MTRTTIGEPCLEGEGGGPTDSVGLGGKRVPRGIVAGVPSASRGRPHAEPSSPRRSVLVVEDNPGDAEYVADLLVGMGRERESIIVVTTLAAAMVQLVTLPIQAALLDLKLPDATGLECVRGVRAIAEDLPIVVLTGNDEEELALACIGAGAQDYLYKSDLRRETLRRALDYAVVRVHERRATSRLRIAQEHLASIVEASSDAIFSTTSRGVILSWNAGAERIFGLKEDEAVGKNVHDVLGTTEAESFEYERRFLDTSRTSSSARPEEMVSRRADGALITLSIASSRLRDASGAMSGFAAVCRDVTESRRRDGEIRRKNEELLARDVEMRALAGRLNAVREEESTRIARAVHDELGQLLTGLRLDLAWIAKRVGGMTEDELDGLLRDAMGLADRTIEAVQRIATELRPPSLDAVGLSAAILDEAVRFEKRTGVVAEVVTDDISEPDSEVVTTLFRICQELLTNVARHASAKHIRILLDDSARGWLLRVEDDGVGIADVELGLHSLGILGMRERASLVGGELVIARGAEGGTIATVRIPRRTGAGAG